MKKILVIDDAEFILESTSALLEFEGYDVITAENGKIGVEMAKEFKPDLILCDISMPVMDGFEVLDNIRSDNITHRTPFIFLTAFNEKSNMRDGMTKGADDYLVKPYSRDEIVSAINAQWKKYNVFEKHVKSKVEQVGKSVTYALPHEFRTAINEIKGNAGIIYQESESLDTNEIKMLSHDIVQSVSRLSKITESYLLYIRLNNIEDNEELIEEIKLQRTEEPFAVAYDIVNNIAAKYDRFEDFIVKNETMGICINMSSENFYVIMNELSDNAFKFSKKGDKVTMSSKIINDKLFIELSDEGIGIDENQISNIAALNQFNREKNEQQGIGLGLIIAKKMIELHNGDFNIIGNGIGNGTKITLSFPITQ
ncbi:MAG: hybrid sensor histidine kinase/response regulator [Ignavibacteriae bacterium HGW-Ignavibacteriae-4]|jgi:CheY-like chemotaxis protein|nr:MAG: hybrid sensor histidine kinase/response regulator [Ignavibacteriae bacterium HGW-Ignavibacteriae-4]